MKKHIKNISILFLCGICIYFMYQDYLNYTKLNILNNQISKLTHDYNKLVVQKSNEGLGLIDSLIVIEIAKAAKFNTYQIVPKSEIGYQYGALYGDELPVVLNFLYAILPDTLPDKNLILYILNDRKYKNSTNQKETFLKMYQQYQLMKNENH